MKFYNLQSLKIKISLIIFITALPLSILIIKINSDLRRKSLTELKTDSNNLSVLLQQNEENTVIGIHKILEGISTFQTNNIGASQKDNFFKNLTNSFPELQNIGDYNPISNSILSAFPLSNTEINYVKKIILIKFKHNANKLFSKQLNDSTIIFAHVSQIGNSKKQEEISFAIVNIDSIAGQQKYLNSDFSQKTIIAETDTEGNISVFFPLKDNKEINKRYLTNYFKSKLKNKIEKDDTVPLNGEDFLFTFNHFYSPLFKAERYLFIGVPKNEALNIENSIMRNLLPWFIIAALLALIFSIIGANKFVLNPLDKIIKAAKFIKEKKYSSRSGITNLKGEMGELAIIFDEMAQSIELYDNQQEKDKTNLYRTNRALKAISDCNQAIIHFDKEGELYSKVCKIIVDAEGYLFSVIGLKIYDENKSIKIIASSGVSEEILNKVNFTWGNDGSPFCPVGNTIREGRLHTINDVAKEGNEIPYIEYAKVLGINSILSLPLIINSDTYGVLTIFSTESNMFDQEEISLLSELADDLSFGVQSIRLKNENQKINKSLLESVRFAKETLNSIWSRVAVLDENYNIIETNKSWDDSIIQKSCYPFLFSKGENYLKSIESNLSSINEDGNKLIELLKEVHSGEANSVSMEYSYRQDNSQVWCLVRISRFINHEPLRLVIKHENITDIKLSQVKIAESEKRYRQLAESLPQTIVEFDFEGKVKYVNQTGMKIFNLSSEEIIQGVNVFDFLYPDDIDYAKSNLQKILSGELKNIGNKYTALKKDGSMFPIIIYSDFILSDNMRVGFRAIIIDITELQKATEQLQKDEEKFRSIFENIQDIYYQSDLDGKIIEVSSSVSKYGYKREELLNTNVYNIYSNAEDRAKFVSDIILFGEVNDFETQMKIKTGESIYVSMNSRCRYDSIGKVIGFEGAIRNIEKRKRSEEEIRKLYHGVEQSPASIIITDLKGNIEYVNKKVIELTGYLLEEIIGKNSKIFSSGEKSIDEYKVMWDTILAGKEWHGEFHNKKKTGELYWESASISPIVNDKDKITHFIAIKENITEHKKMLDELIAAKEKAEEMNRVKSNFFANMSHELRTPLIGILGYSDFLKEELANTQLLEMVETINTSGNRLLNTLNLILQISKIDSEKLDVHYEIFDVIGIVKEVIILWKVSAEKNELYLNLDAASEKLEINLDKQFLYEIVNNLVCNAIKYTKNGGITVKISQTNEGQNSWVIIKVIDTGIGISKENQEIIFHEFRQASEGISRAFEGTGLGLTISKKLTEKLGGSISVESEVGYGSTFTVKLPVNYTSVSQQALEIAKGNNVKKESNNNIENKNNNLTQEILLVENDPVSTSVTSLFLKNYYKIDSCSKADDAVQMTKLKKYVAVLMDINLGLGKTGLDAAKEIKLIKEYTKVPIIALTAFAMSGDREEFIKAGCTHYLSKPFTKGDLLNIIQDALLSNITI
ncbi:MAG: PAS domain S-box protein [Ignavibacteriaceae bacterium]